MFHDVPWKAVYFGVKGSKIKVTSSKTTPTDRRLITFLEALSFAAVRCVGSNSDFSCRSGVKLLFFLFLLSYGTARRTDGRIVVRCGGTYQRPFCHCILQCCTVELPTSLGGTTFSDSTHLWLRASAGMERRSHRKWHRSDGDGESVCSPSHHSASSAASFRPPSDVPYTTIRKPR